MNQIKKEDIKQEVFDLYDDYAHNRVNRRDFMQILTIKPLCFRKNNLKIE